MDLRPDELQGSVDPDSKVSAEWICVDDPAIVLFLYRKGLGNPRAGWHQGDLVVLAAKEYINSGRFSPHPVQILVKKEYSAFT